MGYHGFGMRKEVYTRKPKKAFDKIKKYNKKNPYAAPTQRDDREVYIHTYHKPAYKRWWFILMALGFVGYFGHIIWFENILPERRYQQAIAAFEEGGILDYYLENQAEVDAVFKLMNQSNGAWTDLEIYGIHDKQIIRVQSRRKVLGEERAQFSFVNCAPSRYYVEKDLLKYTDPAQTEIRAHGWQAKVPAESLDEIPSSFLNHMRLDEQKLATVLATNKARAWHYHFEPSYHSFNFRKYKRRYTLYFTNDPKAIEYVRAKDLISLAPGIYWN